MAIVTDLVSAVEASDSDQYREPQGPVDPSTGTVHESSDAEALPLHRKVDRVGSIR